MSMATTELRPAFRRRFRRVARQMWSLHVGRGLAMIVLVAAAMLGTAAFVDYFFELPWPARAGVFGVGVAAVAFLAAKWVFAPARVWRWSKVAAELEGLFPRLGQRLRTAAQHGHRPADHLRRDGVSPSLVAALELETAEKVKPLPLEAGLPARPALLAAVAAAICIGLVALPAARNDEWRTAWNRAVLSPAPYSTLTAEPSAEAVTEGQDVEVRAALTGRARPAAVLHVREVGEPAWREETMDAADGGFVARLSRLRNTIELFVTAGPERTAARPIVVRHPLKIAGIRAEVTSPSYTGVAPAAHESGSFSAVQGSVAKLRFELDQPPVSAALVVSEPGASRAPSRRIELAVTDRVLSAELPLAADMEYTVEGRDADGMPVWPNKHRIRVTPDHPPAVWFDTPSEGFEVHTLAEVLMRARAKDDFGLTKLGIVFQVNNEEERELVLMDIREPMQREAKAEQVLMLEQFLLTQKDCVAYYAFAEDNRPGTPQRATTELRFIDIRPFQRIYRLVDVPEDGDGGGMRREIIFLDEVVARQRFNLNQTMRLETRSKVRLDLAQVEKVAAFENKLAQQTHDLADFLAGLGVDGAAILGQAEEAMLSAVDSLNGAKFPTAIGQERDALRYLMEARNTIQIALTKQSRAVRAQARAFDRLQRQKLRRENEKSDSLPQIAEELNRLANEEDEVSRTIAAGGKGENPMGGGDGDPEKSEKPAKGKPDPAAEKQEEIAGAAAAIDKLAEKAKGLTGLAKNRITEGAKAANAAADALGQSDRDAARPEVDKARETFRAAAKQVAALAAEEGTQQLAAARDLANDVALETAPPDPDRKMPGAGGAGDRDTRNLGSAAEDAKSLKDVLENLAASGKPSDADAARKAAGVLRQENLPDAIARMEKLGVGGDRAERKDLADRFAALGQKLDEAYRESVAPRLEEIARLEREANELEQQTARAGDEDWRRLRQQGAQLLARLEEAGLDALVNDDFRAGLGNALTGREAFGRGITLLHARLVTKLQEFVAVDRIAGGNEPVPPQYKDLVERYLRALSAGGPK
jgi:hypothetical protein